MRIRIYLKNVTLIGVYTLYKQKYFAIYTFSLSTERICENNTELEQDDDKS